MSSLTNAFGPPLAKLVQGKGSYVWDSEGVKYLDFLGGIAVNALGHAHPRLVAAVSEQMATLGHISNFFVSEPQIALADRLSEIANLGDGTKVFFSNSGAEANETALKMIRLHGNKVGKSKVVAFDGAFHGRTMGSLALTANPAYREPFQPLPGGVVHIAPTQHALEQAFESGDVAAVVLEPIQGEAGVLPLPKGLMETARRLTEENSALLVVDEVQTGVGRTGFWFGHQHLELGLPIKPDIVTSAKGLAGGIPIGATIAGPLAADLLYPGSHGSTFGGSPVACSAALAVIDTIVDDDLMENVQLQNAWLKEQLFALGSSRIAGITGQGLLLGIQLNEPVAKPVANRAFELGLIVNAPKDSTIRIAPPLIIGKKEVEQFISIFSNALSI